MRRRFFCAAVSLSLAACGGSELWSPRAPAAVAVTDYRAQPASSKLDALRARADAMPDDFQAQFDAGMGHMWSTLEGDLGHRELAERYLERAWRADPRAQPTAQILARFLNMRSTALDFSRLELQIELYESIVRGPADPVRSGREEFTFDCFLEAARAMREHDRGHTLAAYARVARLERRLATRLRAHPHEVDTHAMAGNYALGFAGSLPIGRERRLRQAIAHLKIQQARWEQLSPGARAQWMAPNVRVVWAFMLAEASTAAGELEQARVSYERVIASAQAESLPAQALAQVSRERLGRLHEYAGREELLPVWPAGPASCMACHSESARLPTAGLFRLEGDG